MAGSIADIKLENVYHDDNDGTTFRVLYFLAYNNKHVLIVKILDTVYCYRLLRVHRA